MAKFGLIGERLGHSFSPLIHSKLGDYEYVLCETEEAGLPALLADREFQGFNVTIPYKKKVMELCDEVSSESVRIGCVNTVVREEDGKLHGYNTDYFGFRYLMEENQIDPGGRKCLVLGSGGASLTVRTVLADLGAREIVIISRSGPDNYDNLDKHYDADIIVNTTPVGMFPDNLSSPISLYGFKNLRGVVDVIYNPHNTKLVLSAMKKDIPSAGGLDMLVAQAWQASMLFEGTDCDRSEIRDVVNEVLDETKNTILIGMPGAGKTFLGRKMAEKDGKEFLDIDEMIEEHEGCSIPEIFKNKGEDYFRSIETQMFDLACRRQGVVIAAGGGIIKREINHDIARQNGVVIWVKRDPDKLETNGRPLSLTTPLDQMYAERKDAYERWSDFFIDNNQELD